jgi:hypothetical protein
MSQPCVQTNPRIRSRKRPKEDICRLLKTKSTAAEPNNNISSGEQPLNLCVRDSPPPVQSIRSVPAASASLRRRKKRSAIFVPPEKLSNEVCICKFKFVAGHQPRLQEKKVLSIDSGGNFKFFPEVHPPAPPDPPESPVLFQPLTPESPTAVPAKPIPDLIPIQTLPGLSSPAPVLGPEPQCVAPNSSSTSTKVRKLSRRQKLEQTFREKGNY